MDALHVSASACDWRRPGTDSGTYIYRSTYCGTYCHRHGSTAKSNSDSDTSDAHTNSVPDFVAHSNVSARINDVVELR